MQKNRVGRVFALSLSWEKVKISDCAKIMQAFKPEYIFVKYLDAEKGVFLTREFYTGNGTAPLFSTKTGKWESLSFKLTARRNAL